MSRLLVAGGLVIATTTLGCGGGSATDAGRTDAALDAAVDASGPRLYGTMTWKMRCPSPASLPPDCAMGCTEGLDRLVDGFAGENGADISCRVTETAAERTLSFEMRHTSGYSVTFENVRVPRDGGSALGGLVRVREDDVYEGAAGPAAPSVSQPCQVSLVEFFTDEPSGDPTVRGEVVCRYMRSDMDAQMCRDLSTSGGAGAASMPAQFTLFGCAGLVLP